MEDGDLISMEDGGDGAVRVVARICPASAPAAGTSLFQVAAARGRCPRASGATVSFTPAAASSSSSSPSQGHRRRPAAGQRKEEHSLDWCYLQEETNHHVFHHELQPILANHMRNQTHTTAGSSSSSSSGNACVVACGAAAAKDHLFKGSQEQPGLVTIAMEQILYFAASIGGAVRVSSYQVVQDTHVYDLLEPKEQEEDAHGKTHLEGLSKVHVKTIEDFTRLGCFDENQDKQQQPTKPFSTQPQPTKASSTQLPTRGHQGLIIHISSSDQDGKERHVAKINFLSLSDYVDPKQKTGGAAAALSNVVQALNSNQSLVPYRESEVTRILQDSLCKTSGAVVIACLEEVSCQDAVSTLSLAARSSHLATQVANKEESVPVPPPKRGRGRPRRRERSALLEPEPKGRASGCGGNNDSCKGRNCGWTDSYPCNCGVMVGKACSCGRPDIDCCSLGDKDACHCDKYLVAKIRDRNQKKLDERQTEKVEERTREIGSRLPVFVKLMKQPDIQKPDLNFCTMYARKCLWLERDHDEARVLLVLEGTTMQWCSKLTVDKYRKNEDESKEPSWFIKFKAWETVVLEASIKAQDICLFELVGRCSNGLMMKLHLIRSQPKVKRSLSPSTSECRGPLEKKKKKKKKMHAPNSPSPKAPAEETHAGPEGSEE